MIAVVAASPVAPSRAHLDDLVGQRQHSIVVGRHDHDAAAVGEASNETQHALDLDVVEVSGGFVGQHQRGVERQGAGDGHTLLLTAAQVVRFVGQPIAESDALQQARRPSPWRLVPTPAERMGRDVLDAVQAGHEVECLEDDADAMAPVLGEVRPVNAVISVSPDT